MVPNILEEKSLDDDKEVAVKYTVNDAVRDALKDSFRNTIDDTLEL